MRRIVILYSDGVIRDSHDVGQTGRPEVVVQPRVEAAGVAFHQAGKQAALVAGKGPGRGAQPRPQATCQALQPGRGAQDPWWPPRRDQRGDVIPHAWTLHAPLGREVLAGQQAEPVLVGGQDEHRFAQVDVPARDEQPLHPHVGDNELPKRQHVGLWRYGARVVGEHPLDGHAGGRAGRLGQRTGTAGVHPGGGRQPSGSRAHAHCRHDGGARAARPEQDERCEQGDTAGAQGEHPRWEQPALPGDEPGSNRRQRHPQV